MAGRIVVLLAIIGGITALIGLFFYFFPADCFWCGPNIVDSGAAPREPEFDNALAGFGKAAPLVLLVGVIALVTWPIWRPFTWVRDSLRRHSV